MSTALYGAAAALAGGPPGGDWGVGAVLGVFESVIMLLVVCKGTSSRGVQMTPIMRLMGGWRASDCFWLVHNGSLVVLFLFMSVSMRGLDPMFRWWTAGAVVALVAACSTSKTHVGGDTDMPIANPQAASAPEDGGISRCVKRLGTLAITESDTNAQALQSAGLPRSVAPLVRYLLTTSNCFTVVDRGAAFALMERERAMYDARGLARPEGRRKLKTVDYVMRAEVVFAEQTEGSKGLLGGVFGSTIGAIGGGYSRKEAVVLLSVVDAASSEIIHSTFGHGYSDALGLGSLVLGKDELLIDGGWSDTPQAKTVAAALLDAWNRTLPKLKELPPPEPGPGVLSGASAPPTKASEAGGAAPSTPTLGASAAGEGMSVPASEPGLVPVASSPGGGSAPVLLPTTVAPNVPSPGDGSSSQH